MPQDRNPIMSDEQSSVLDFMGTHSSGGSTATVYLADSGQIATRNPSLRERSQTRFRRYEIDMTHHAETLRFTLPSAEEAFKFRTRMYLTWTVHDPGRVAQLRMRDAQSSFWPFLTQRLRPISRRFSIEENALAEAELNNDLKAAPFHLDSGIELYSCAIVLDLDESTQQHLARRTAIQRETQLAQETHRLQAIKDEYAGERARLQQAFDQQTTTHELALKGQRMDFYRLAVDQGSAGYLILQLIEHPNDIKAVVSMLEAQHDAHFKKAHDLMANLIERELVHAADLDPVRQHVVGRLLDALNRPGPDRPPLLQTLNPEEV